jgi:predicted metal-dependent phosphoesterase TrpH
LTASARFVDLHVHTTASDGSLSPTEVVTAARAAGVAAIAICDHDTMAGLDEASDAAKAAGIELLTGVEVSVEWPGSSMHILGFCVDPHDKALVDLLARFRDFRGERNRRILDRLTQLDMPLAAQAVAAHAGGETVGRLHMAQAMVDAGYAASTDEAFRRWLTRGAPAYVERVRATPQEAIATIRAAGGLAALAHPRQLHRPFVEARTAVGRLADQGLEGLEAWHPDHSADDMRMYATMAERFDLVATGGSDFHGHLRHGVALGVGRGGLRIPYSVVEKLRDRLARRTTVEPVAEDR